MATERTPDQILDWHRWFAVRCNNDTWDLIEKEGRTSLEDRRMLDLAHAASFHWTMAGTPLHRARADITLARVQAQLGAGHEATKHAQLALDYVEHSACEDSDVALAHVAAADAAAVLGDEARHREHYQRAWDLADSLAEAEDRAIVRADPDRIARPPGWDR